MMVLIQILLPAAIPGCDTTPAFATTREELVQRFKGLTAYSRAPAKGVWTAPDGRTDRDDMVMVEVVKESFDKTWWRAYAAVLAVRFHQDTIHVRAVPIQLADEKMA
jgi:hypothetical protein